MRGGIRVETYLGGDLIHDHHHRGASHLTGGGSEHVATAIDRHIDRTRPRIRRTVYT